MGGEIRCESIVGKGTKIRFDINIGINWNDKDCQIKKIKILRILLKR